MQILITFFHSFSTHSNEDNSSIPEEIDGEAFSIGSLKSEHSKVPGMGEQLPVHKLDKGEGVPVGKEGSFTEHMMNFPMSFNQFTCFALFYIKGVCESVVCPRLARGRIGPSDYTLWAPNPLDSRTHDQTFNRDFWPR